METIKDKKDISKIKKAARLSMTKLRLRNSKFVFNSNTIGCSLSKESLMMDMKIPLTDENIAVQEIIRLTGFGLELKISARIAPTKKMPKDAKNMYTTAVSGIFRPPKTIIRYNNHNITTFDMGCQRQDRVSLL